MPLTLPDTAGLGDPGHITDHNLLTTALTALESTVAAKAPSASPTFTGTVALPATTTLNGVTLTGGGLTFIASAAPSGASAVNINSCYSATYDSYRVVVSLGAVSVSDAILNFRFRVGGADNTAASYYGVQNYTPWASASSVQGQVSAGTAFSLAYTAAGLVVTLDIRGPFASENTHLAGLFTHANYGAATYGRFAATTSFDGFSIYPASGTITGRVMVFGYRNS